MKCTDKHRLFLAVPIPQKITHDLKQPLRELSHLPQGRWVSAGNVHLTIRFLGEVAVDLIENFWQAIAAQLKDNFQSFECQIESVSHFPDSKPHVIAAIVKNSEPLQQLFFQVNAVAAQFDIALKTTPFKPHITLYRCKHHCKPIAPIVIENCVLRVDELVLYWSEPSPTGSVYTRLQSLPFK